MNDHSATNSTYAATPLRLSVVIPVFNERGNVQPLIEEVQTALRDLEGGFEVIVVDDASIDGTRELLDRLAGDGVRVQLHQRNCGQSAAVATGFQAARGEWVATLDGDGQNDPADLPAMLAHARAEGVDCVTGVRRKRRDSGLRRWSSRIANGFRNRLTGDRISDSGCGIRVVRRRALGEIPVFNGMHRFLPTLLRAQGYSVRELAVNHRERRSGCSKYGVHNRLWRGIRDCFGVRWYIRRAVPGQRLHGAGPKSNTLPAASPAATFEWAEAGRSGAKKFTVLLAAAALLYLFTHFTSFGEAIRGFDGLENLLNEAGAARSGLLFVMLTAILIVVGVPRLLFFALGGMAFDFTQGLLLALSGSLIGSYVAFRFARWGGRHWLIRRFGERPFFRRVIETRPTASSVALVRMLPLSNVVINAGLAMSRVNSRAFVLGTLVGFLPQGIVAVLIGSGVADEVAWEGALQLAAAAGIVMLIAYWTSRRWQGSNSRLALQLRSRYRDPQTMPYFWLGLIAILCVTLFTIRITAPSDLESYAQHRNVGYIMDLMWEGHWLAQHDVSGRILSKPPLHSWAVAPFAAVLGVDRLALTLPSFFSVLLLAILVFEVGRRRFSLLAGGLAALAVILAPPMAKHIALVRSDPLFTLATAVLAFSAFKAWETGRGWTVFWFMAALATLTKGPLGLLLAAAGLISYAWEKHDDRSAPTLRGPHGKGIILFCAITLSWFLLAWWHYGQPLIDKLFFDELLGQATGANKEAVPGSNLPKPTLFLLGRFLPFSLFAFYGLWRVFRHPAGNARERRFERFLVCWIVAGLVIFSLAAHHRADLLLPLWPACALLAGRELARLSQTFEPRRFHRALGAACVFMVVTVILTYHSPWGRRADNNLYAEQVRAAAAALAASNVNPGELYHLDTPVTLQMYLRTYRQWLDPAELEELIDAGEELLIATMANSLDELDIDLSRVNAESLYRWPDDDSAETSIAIFRLRRE